MGVESPYYRRLESAGTPMAMVEGVERINFCSYDYLGLNAHPAVREAARRAVTEFGVSCSASRVVGGERPPHRLLLSPQPTRP